ncbi:MAG: hypothetical protein ACI9MB_000752, partial [Verrucomicrobiales bacterium]
PSQNPHARKRLNLPEDFTKHIPLVFLEDEIPINDPAQAMVKRATSNSR